ncbi:aminodeoxychorismate synthase component I [Undibacterium arcticum]|uniref:Aminodeoxychorismate synthase component I n=1 Tax=Undibacterium arcticum TaxID=1762892 RepID=A0ABV7F240_9BURK
MNSVTTADCFALLDDSSATDSEPRSRLFTGHLGTLACDDAAGFADLLAQLQTALQAGQHAVGLFSYELGAALMGTAVIGTAQRGSGPAAPPLAQILLFERCDSLSAAAVERWLAQADVAGASASPAGIANLQASVSEAEFGAALARIHAYIEAGDTYQVNYTYRLRFDAFGTPLALYRRLRARQPVPFGALIGLPDRRAVLSLSPELFVQHQRGVLTARPMKGTAPASGDPRQDAARALELAADPKNRAENLMIVDLLRNDLGRVAQLGSVKVPALFQVQRYSSVLQMTSTVQAELRADATLADIFDALYPCGSITGAPKRRTMQIIRELEPDARGLYTGAIGWFEPPLGDRSVGDFCLSVPIRTLSLQAPRADGVRAGELGVGAGIVHDSIAADEYAECRLKAGFLTGLPNDFELFETIHATRADGCRHLEQHLQRLQASARYFGFACDDALLRQQVQQACAALPDGACRLRLALNQAGICSVQSAPLTPLAEPVTLFLAAPATAAGDPFLRHKSSVRAAYDAAWRAAEARGGFDQLFCNTDGELTEGGRSNVFVRLAGHWYTPPLESGVLPGVMRAQLLADPAWQASERRLTLADLRAAEQVVVCNALRGALRAVVDFGDTPQVG